MDRSTPRTGVRSGQPTILVGTLPPPPQRPTPLWVTVRCPECGKVLCEATPGSTVKKLCDRCKEERVVSIAA